MPRRPAVRQVYDMPPIYYDLSDKVGHPVLVISVDHVARKAYVVTRTSSPHARGHGAVVHPVQPDLGLDEVGWWRMAFPKPVPYAAFDAPDVKPCGMLDEATWAKIVSSMQGAEK
jgi:hypothetical protein